MARGIAIKKLLRKLFNQELSAKSNLKKYKSVIISSQYKAIK